MSFSRPSLIVPALFALSGACGLIYEVVWAKQIAAFIGITAHAQLVVLATFMGGLALGAWWLGRGVTASSGLRRYALLELALGAYAMLFPLLLAALTDWYVLAARPWYPSPLALLLARAALAMAVLLPPVVLMGGTLPALTAWLVRGLDELRPRVALLYAVNSAGAVAGSLLAGYLLIAALGLTGTGILTAAVNLLLGAIALWLSRPARTAADADVAAAITPGIAVGMTPVKNLHEVATVPAASPLAVAFARRSALLIAMASGCITMALEVAYLRLGVLVTGSSTYTFSLMLAAFISGIALGAWFIGRRSGDVHSGLPAWLLLGAGTLLGLMLPWYDRLPFWLAQLRLQLPVTDGGYLLWQLAAGGGAFLLMLAPTAIAGGAFPAAIRLRAVADGDAARAVGTIYAVNTLAGIVGIAGAGLALPVVGLQGLFICCLLLYVVAVVCVLPPARARRGLLPALALAIAGIYFMLQPWHLPTLHGGYFRRGQATAVVAGQCWDEYLAAYSAGGETLEAVCDGEGASVALMRYGSGLTMFINGKADAGTADDLTQRMIGHLPLLLHSRPQTALVIGLGSGATAAAVAAHRLERVDVVELLPEVAQMAARFYDYCGDPFARPGVTLYLDDAMHYLRVSDRSYDVITGEPTNPWQAGVGNLFTLEYYRLVEQRLAPGGIFCQFIPAYETSDEVVAMLVRTLRAVFPHIVVCSTMANDMVLLATREPLRFAAAAVARAVQAPEVADGLRAANVPAEFGVAALAQTDEALLAAKLPPGALNTLDWPRAEYLAPRPFFLGSRPYMFVTMDQRFIPGRPTAWWRTVTGDRPAPVAVLRGLLAMAEHARHQQLQEKVGRALAQRLPVAELSPDLQRLRAEDAPASPPPPAADMAELATAYQREEDRYLRLYSEYFQPDPRPGANLARRLERLDPARWQSIAARWRALEQQLQQP